MTVTLHWWYLPISILVAGIWWAWKLVSDPSNDGFFNFGGIMAAFVFGASILCALGVCVGRWIG